jgi:hypothetical protein
MLGMLVGVGWWRAEARLGYDADIAGCLFMTRMREAATKSPGRAGALSSLVEIATVGLIYYAALTSIFFAGFCASAFLGSVSVSTPFLKLASILSASTPSGISKRRSNEPRLRSRI